MISAVVAAVRIKQWISRTTDLYLVRGASEALSKQTKHALIDVKLKSASLTARTDPNAPDIDGVVVMAVATAADAEAAIEWLLVYLAQRLPGVEWTGWAHEAPDYVTAYDHVNVLNQSPSVGHWHRPPLTVDVPIGLGCDGCAQETATASITHNDPVRLGPDCIARFDANDWKKEKDRPEDFEALARFGGLRPGQREWVVGRRGARNHLATIAADGNRVGELFKALTSLPGEVQHAASKALDEANAQAIACARKPWDGAKVAVLIKHYAGGDDLLLSVAAPAAWPLVAQLSAEFERAFQEKLTTTLTGTTRPEPQRRLLQAKCAQVSLGIGVVFANRKHPFAHCAQVAHTAMSYAKRATRGERSAVSWADLTVEDRAVRERSVALSELQDDISTTPSQDAAGRLEVLTLNSSARDAVQGILLEGRRGQYPPGVIAGHLESWARRTGNELPGMSEAKNWTGDQLDEFEALLDRARWWPVQQPAPTEVIA